MKKPEILIGDFIRLNSQGLNKMTTEAPEIATAFATVMKQLAIKYGNITIPGQPGSATTGTTATTQTKPLLELKNKQDFADAIIGDIITIRDTDYPVVITEAKLTDAFNETFTVEITYKPLIRDIKNKNKQTKIVIENYYDYFVTPYGRTIDNYTSKDIIMNKKTNLVNLICSMPIFKFNNPDGTANEHYFFQEHLVELKGNFYTKTYEFKHLDTQSTYVISIQDVIKMFFNEELSDKIFCETFLLPVLVKEHFLYEVKAVDIIGIKLIEADKLRNITANSDEDNFYVITEITSNKPKNKLYKLVQYDNSGGVISTRTMNITPDSATELIKDFYKGFLKPQNCFVQSPFDNTKPYEFIEKFRTYNSNELNNIFIFSIWRYVADINKLYSEKPNKYGRHTNFETSKTVFKLFAKPTYLKKLVEENLTFTSSYYQSEPIVRKIAYFISTDLGFFYKDSSISDYRFDSAEFYDKIFTVLPFLDLSIDCPYNNPVIKLADIIIQQGDSFMWYNQSEINQNVLVNYNEIYKYDSVDLKSKNLMFNYITNGDVDKTEEQTSKIKFNDFVNDFLKRQRVLILNRFDNYKFQGEIIDFKVNGKYLISYNSNANPFECHIENRYIEKSSGIAGTLVLQFKPGFYPVEINKQLKYRNLFIMYNPFGLKIGDKVKVLSMVGLSELEQQMKNANQDYAIIVNRYQGTTGFYIALNQQNANDYKYYQTDIQNLQPYDSTGTQTPQNKIDFETIKIGDLEVYDAELGIMDYDDAMRFAENFQSPIGIGKGWRLPTVEEFKEIFKVGSKNELKNAKSTVFWSSEMPTDNMYAYAYNIELGGVEVRPRTQSKSVLLVRNYNEPKTITVTALPGLEILDEDIKELTYEQAKSTVKDLGSDWRLPTEIEMKLMNPEIKFNFNNYWINEEYKLYSTIHDETTTNNTVGLKYPIRPVKGSYDPKLQTTPQPAKIETITFNSLPGIEAINFDVPNVTYEQAKQTLKGLNSGLVSDWRFPTDNEMKSMSNEIRFDFDRYWVNEEDTYYSVLERLGGKAILITAQYPVRFVKGTLNSQTTNEIQVGDIVEFEPDGGVFSAEKGAKAIVISIDNSTYDVVWLDELSHTQSNGGYFKESFVKSKTQSLFKQGDFVKSYRSPTKKLEIISLKGFVDGAFQYVVEEKANGYRESFFEYDLEPYEEPKQAKFKVGDIVIVKRIGPTQKYEVISFETAVNGVDVFVDLKRTDGRTFEYFDSELQLYEEPKQTQTTPQPANISIVQNIETIPSELSKQYYFDVNDGGRNAPTQPAGDLKRDYKGTMYEQELLSTYFKGNDGLWYKINVETGGVWKWRKADPQPQEPQTQNEPTLNRDYASMSQIELEQRETDIKIALEVFDEEDEEYKELQSELDLIKLYLE